MKHREVLTALNELFPDKTYCGADMTSHRYPTNKPGVFSVTYTVWAHFEDPDSDNVDRINSVSGALSWESAWETFRINYNEYKVEMELLEVKS